ncbi:uncharacterized protein [Procambarus clarkii]|uniref:uncharacterized protein isoform X2 n=1 Tax=Procambarus clarkii TaxID=6728 RepID=UPI001E67134C|nr:uncharacterized protein LOC123775358 isoform X2 [Procambarus clarkii]
MSSGERRPLKRKAEESLEQEHGRSKTGKEARTEVLVAGCTTAGNIGILTLSDNDWACLDSPPIHTKENTASISKREENKDGSVSCGVMWRGDEGRQLDSSVPQVCLSCKREANGKTSDCGTQTFHFLPATSAPEAFVLESGCKTETSKQVALASVNLKNIKVEVPDDQEYERHPLVCCVRDCESRSNEADSIIFYAVPHNKELKLFWAEVLDIIVPDCYSSSEQYVCSLHFITPQKLPVVKTKTRKKKTCDMLVAEEAEKIKQGLSAGRPKRTPKPNKNYDWAELTPFIKTELSDPDEMEFVPVSKAQVKSSALVGRRRKQALTPVKKEDKENEMPSPDTGTSVFENEDEYGENVSLPSHPRAPPPKPKGRPHRIRDTCTQTDALHSSLKQPLREVKVQCNLSTEPLISCPNCSIIDWMKLEELLIDYLAKIEGELCDPVLSEYFRNLVSDVQEPTHATNVLKLLSGLERDSLEGTKDIILISSQDDEVEIENVIHPEVEAPMTGLREITPKLWQENTKWKKEIEPDEDVVEDDTDGLGLQEATEIDDDEFHPGFPEPDEDEEEDQELDDEDWNINKRDSDSGISSSKRKQKKVNQRSKKDPGGHVLTSTVKACLPASRPHLQTPPQEHTGICASTGESSAHPPSALHAAPHRHEPHRDGGPNKGGASQRDGRSPGTRRLQRGGSSRTDGPDREGVSENEGSTSKAHYSCDECGKTFTQRQAVRYHKVWRHNAERRGPCPHCNYKAPDSTKLTLHIKKVHRGYMPYKCKFCTKQFKCHSNHKEHEARHQGGGNLKCQFCEKKFALRSSLERHVRYHNGGRPFCCQHCGKNFKVKPHLERHVKCIHLKEKPVICKVCGAAHHNNWNLKTHMKIHQLCERNPGHSCSVCCCQFKNSSGLMAHMRKTHTVTVDQPSQPAELEATVPTSSAECPLVRDEPDTSRGPEEPPTEQLPIILQAQMTDHRTIVIHDTSPHHHQPPQLDHHLPYDELLQGSSMHTLELYSCDNCLMVFQSEEELLEHRCTHSFTTSQ